MPDDNSPGNLKDRTDFERVRLFEVTQPTRLPPSYSWLSPGQYAVYQGDFKYGGQASEANWAWQIEYVNGVTVETHPAGQSASLGYTVFLGCGSITFGEYAGFPVRPVGFPDPHRRQRPMWVSVATIFPSL